MSFTPEQLAKVKAAKSAEELLALARENGVEMTEEKAETYFVELHKEGELSNEELDNVVGGTCYSSGVKDPYRGKWRQYAIVSPVNSCPYLRCYCCNCNHSFTDGGTWYCADRWLTENGEESVF